MKSTTALNNERDRRGRRKENGRERGGKGGGKASSYDSVIGLCVYSSTVFPSHHCIFIQPIVGFGRKGLYCLLPTL